MVTRLARAILFCSAIALVACESGSNPSLDPDPAPGAGGVIGPLREMAARCGIRIGPAVAHGPLVDDPVYGDTLRREFDILTPENEMKWGFVQPQRAQYAFDRADAIMAFAASNDLKVHGHALVWHEQNPEWLTSGRFSRAEMIDILRDHISTVAGRFAGRNLVAWDVVNEAVDDDGSLRRTIWLDRVGAEYIDLAFQFARAADRDARLIYNDYGNETINAKSTAIYNLLAGMIARGVPVHGVGLQLHITMAGVDLTSVAQNMQRFAALGLEIYITELDVRVPLPATASALETQSSVYRGVLNACLGQPLCKAFQTWGFTDAHSWIPGSYSGFGAALIFDEGYRPKPAYEALAQRLSQCPVRSQFPADSQ